MGTKKHRPGFPKRCPCEGKGAWMARELQNELDTDPELVFYKLQNYH